MSAGGSMSRPISSGLRAGAAVSLLLLAGCARGLASRAGGFDVSRHEIPVAGRTYHVTYVKPEAAAPQKPLIVLFTGDAGWMGTSGMLLEHLAAAGYPVAGFDSRHALKPIK